MRVESSTNSKIIQTSKPTVFEFRPWVRKTGMSILLVAGALTALLVVLLWASPASRYGWASEPVVAIYLAVLWVGGARVYFGTFRPVAELHESVLMLRPLHTFTPRRVGWDAVEGTEQLVRGDRLIVHYRSPGGRRFVALNLNLVKGRREFLRALEERLSRLGFFEQLVGESRYLVRGAEPITK